MKSQEKKKHTKSSGKKEKDNDQLYKTRKRLEQQKEALRKIIEQFSKREK